MLKLKEKDVWGLRFLNPNNAKAVYVEQIEPKQITNIREYNGKVYINMGGISRYNDIEEKCEINLAEEFLYHIIAENYPHSKKYIGVATDNDIYIIADYTKNYITLRYGILKDGKLYEEPKDDWTMGVLQLLRHTGQQNLQNELRDTYDNFVEFVSNQICRQIRPDVEEKFKPKGEFGADVIENKCYTQIRKKINKPLSTEHNDGMISFSPWYNISKIEI